MRRKPLGLQKNYSSHVEQDEPVNNNIPRNSKNCRIAGLGF